MAQSSPASEEISVGYDNYLSLQSCGTGPQDTCDNGRAPPSVDTTLGQALGDGTPPRSTSLHFDALDLESPWYTPSHVDIKEEARLFDGLFGEAEIDSARNVNPCTGQVVVHGGRDEEPIVVNRGLGIAGRDLNGPEGLVADHSLRETAVDRSVEELARRHIDRDSRGEQNEHKTTWTSTSPQHVLPSWLRLDLDVCTVRVASGRWE